MQVQTLFIAKFFMNGFKKQNLFYESKSKSKAIFGIYENSHILVLLETF